MLTAALIALPLLFQSVDGLAFSEAMARAEKYEKDAKAQTWRDEVMVPFLRPKTDGLFARCYKSQRPVKFTLVLSFKSGRFDRVVSSSEEADARCMAETLAEYRWPKAPYDDFAEEFTVDLAPY